jgi:[glutamine synthetase] adenylyltransferase / [glutamine synthetase]-adenylyl-L-tyrosine phosphorylase
LALFRDVNASEKARERIERLTALDLQRFFSDAFQNNPDPDRALVNLERWLNATSNPGTQLAHLASGPELANLLLMILAASQPLADALIQNPELSNLVTDARALSAVPDRASIEHEGRRLLSASSSYSHSLDRLRYLKQRWMLPLAVNDLLGAWSEETVWLVLSDLADALITLAREIAWAEFSAEKGIDVDCPLMIVAFGKLGGRELNYSSDIDLVYVTPDHMDEMLERQVMRFCEMLGRALNDRMGRGTLYRVDLRLRPYGGAGAITRSMRSVEGYYRTYAEPWEVQALIRSRPVCGPPDLARRWDAMVEDVCFPPQVSELTIESALAMRQRVEEHAPDDDLKRGPGGIRDVEFLTQILQMVHGNKEPEVRVKSTCDALRALDEAHELDHSASQSLIRGYRFLRQLEHRIQLVHDRQTHSVPEQTEAREHLARLMHLESWQRLRDRLRFQRKSIRSLYESMLHPEVHATDERNEVRQRLGSLGPAALQWFDVLPESEMFYTSLLENEGSLQRVKRILVEAPALVQCFRSSVSLTENLMSGEIEEELDVAQRIERLEPSAPLEVVAEAVSSGWCTLATRGSLHAEEPIAAELTAMYDALIVHVMKRIYASFEVIAAGTYGVRDLSLRSDLDLLFLQPPDVPRGEAESQAQQILAILDKLKRLGAPIGVDLRLRPEGGQGLLVRTYEGFKSYELTAMEMWERFALGFARPVVASEEATRLVLHAAYAQPLTPERLRELAAMKRRIENERVPPQHRRRHVKLGHGGLSDIEWLVHLHEMRYPTATEAGRHVDLDNRLKLLARAQLINALELEELLEARRYLMRIRDRLQLLGLSPDVVPENPDKLERLGHVEGCGDGNEFLAHHERVIDTVRSIFTDALDRLKA